MLHGKHITSHSGFQRLISLKSLWGFEVQSPINTSSLKRSVVLKLLFVNSVNSNEVVKVTEGMTINEYYHAWFAEYIILKHSMIERKYYELINQVQYHEEGFSCIYQVKRKRCRCIWNFCKICRGIWNFSFHYVNSHCFTTEYSLLKALWKEYKRHHSNTLTAREI